MRRAVFTLVVYLVGALLCLSGPDTLAQKSSEPFSPTRESDIAGQKVKLVMTGQAIRKKIGFPIYAVASYIQAGVQVRSAQELVDADCAKQVHLVMMRKVWGVDMVDSILAILRRNHPAPAFAEESKLLAEKLKPAVADKGDHVLITHIPRVGLHVHCTSGEDFVIRNVGFSKAIWENYLGKHNVGEDVKKGLLSQLAP